MSAATGRELTRINGRGLVNGWHRDQLREQAGRERRTMAEVFSDSIRNVSAFSVPAEAIRIQRGRVFYRFADGSGADFPHERSK